MANGNGNGNGQANTGLNDALHRMIAAVAAQHGGNVPPGAFAGNPPGTPGVVPPGGFPVTQYGAFPPPQPDPNSMFYAPPGQDWPGARGFVPPAAPSGIRPIPGQFRSFDPARDIPRLSPGGTMLPPGMAPSPGMVSSAGAAPPQGGDNAMFDFPGRMQGSGTPQDPYRQPGVDPRDYLTPQESWTAPPGTPPSPPPPDYLRGGAGATAPPLSPGIQPLPGGGVQFPPGMQPPPPSTFQQQWPLAQLQPPPGQPAPAPPAGRQLAPDQLGPGPAQPLPGRPSGLPGSQYGAEGGVPYQYQRRGQDYRLRGFPGGAPEGGLVPMNALERAYRQQQALLSQGIRPGGVIYGEAPGAAVRGGRQAGQPAAPLTIKDVEPQLPKAPSFGEAYTAAKTYAPGNANDREIYNAAVSMYGNMLHKWQADTGNILARMQQQQALAAGQQEQAFKTRQQEAEESYRNAQIALGQGKLKEAMKNNRMQEQGRQADRLIKQQEMASRQDDATLKAMKMQLLLAGNQKDNLPHPRDEKEARALGSGRLWIDPNGNWQVNPGKWSPTGGPAPRGGGTLLDEDEEE